MPNVPWDSFGELTQVQHRVNRVFSDAYGRRAAGAGDDEGLIATGTWAPAVDIYQTDSHELVIKADLPDVAPQDIQLTLENDTLTISGEKRFSNEIREDQCRRIERRYGPFGRSFSLPESVDSSKISAEHKNGVLTVRLPARDEAKPRRVKVEVRG